MSDTIVDMAKVTQMLDAGWQVFIYKGGLGSYEVRARHDNDRVMAETKRRLVATMSENHSFLAETKKTAEEAVEMVDFDDVSLMTDDWTPEQALTRMAYKVHGEIL